jgi:hypothetical protein
MFSNRNSPKTDDEPFYLSRCYSVSVHLFPFHVVCLFEVNERIMVAYAYVLEAKQFILLLNIVDSLSAKNVAFLFRHRNPSSLKRSWLRNWIQKFGNFSL